MLPITPSSITVNIKNQNKIINLINEGEFNILKDEGLKDISFDMLIPAFKYPFAQYIGGIFLPIKYYLSNLERLKKKKKPIDFIILRSGIVGTVGFDTVLKVSIEDYQIKEDANNDGQDVLVSIKLKEYTSLNSKILKIVSAGIGLLTLARDFSSKDIQKYYEVKAGDTLFLIAKKELGDEKKVDFLKKINNKKSILDLKIGEMIKLED